MSEYEAAQSASAAAADAWQAADAAHDAAQVAQEAAAIMPAAPMELPGMGSDSDTATAGADLSTGQPSGPGDFS